MTTTTDQLANIPHPAGAVKVYDWDELGRPSRYWRGSSWIVEKNLQPDAEDIEVFIDGMQHADGRVERLVHVHQTHADDSFTLEQFRQLARVLIAAVDEAEKMNGYDKVTVST